MNEKKHGKWWLKRRSFRCTRCGHLNRILNPPKRNIHGCMGTFPNRYWKREYYWDGFKFWIKNRINRLILHGGRQWKEIK